MRHGLGTEKISAAPEPFSLPYRSANMEGHKTVTDLTVSDLQTLRQRAPGAQLIDVRSPSEYASGHLPGALNIPVEQFDSRKSDLYQDRPVVLLCKAGSRARMAAAMLPEGGQNVGVLCGGTDAWARAGLPLVTSAKTRWSLERQVRLAAGLIVFVSIAGAVTVLPAMIYLAGLVGLGLTTAGLTDICPMGVLLAKMRWNGPRKSCAVAERGNAGGGLAR